MQIKAFQKYICPIDGIPLLQIAKSLRCDQGHNFDQANESYWNLLLVQNKASLNPGDSKEMVKSRQDFLNAEYYKPIAESIFDSICQVCQVCQKIDADAGLCIVDAGCGEGYYLRKIQEMALLSSASTQLQLAGFDISKWAVRAAAKQNKNLSWAVASNRSIPYADNSIDILLSIFGFPVWESFKKVVKNNGAIILVDPAPNHLLELREIIYEKVEKTSLSSIAEALQKNFFLVEEKELNFSITLQSQEMIQNLLLMTPHGFRISAQGREALKKYNSLTVSITVVLRLLRKTGE